MKTKMKKTLLFLKESTLSEITDLDPELDT